MTDFGDNTDETPIEDAVAEAVQAGVASVRTVIPGRVIDYDHSEQKATVRPVIRSSYKDPDTEKRQTYLPPSIPECPVNFPQGGGFSMTWPLEKGDRVELRIASRSLEEWLSQGGDDIEPADPRRHNITDIIVDPGIRSFANALGSGRLDDAAVVLNGEEFHLGKADDGSLQYIALARLVKDELDKIWEALDGHSHSYTGLKEGATETTGNYTNSTRADKPSSDKVKSE